LAGLSSDVTIPAQSRKLDENPRRSLSGRLVYLPGVVVGNDYILNDLLGRGGMGVVFSATHRIMGKKFALKLLAPELMTAENWQRFQREARALSRLSHSSIVQIYNMGIDRDTTPFYVMELLEGEPLSEIIKTSGPLSENNALACFTAIAEALAVAHKQQIIHRDIKPANIVVSRDEAGKIVFKLVDFGLARLIDEKEKSLLNDGSRDKQALTALGQVFGSPFYMSPEQCRGIDLDSRTDIYSFGCSLFEALTGQVPLAGETPYETFILHQSKVPPRLSEVCPHLVFSEGIELAVAKMLAKTPSMRYQSMDEILHDFSRIGAGRAILGQTKESANYARDKNTQVNLDFSEPDHSPVGSITDALESTLKKRFLISLFILLVVMPMVFLWRHYSKPAPTKHKREVSDQFIPPLPPPNGSEVRARKIVNGVFVEDGNKVRPIPFSLQCKRFGDRQATLTWHTEINEPLTISSVDHRDRKTELANSTIQLEVQFPIRIVFRPDETGTEFLQVFQEGEVGDLEVREVSSAADWKKVFDRLNKWPKLNTLHFRQCTVDQSFYDFLSRRILHLLELHGGNIDLARVAQMPSFMKINQLFLTGAEKAANKSLPPELVEAIKRSKQIRGLKFWSTGLTMPQLKRMLTNPYVRMLEVNGLAWSDADIYWILKSDRLTHLRLIRSDLSQSQIDFIEKISPQKSKEGMRIDLVEPKKFKP
jgi:serine/threonine protein kinase